MARDHNPFGMDKGPSETTEIAMRGYHWISLGASLPINWRGSGAGPRGFPLFGLHTSPDCEAAPKFVTLIATCCYVPPIQRRRARGGGPNAQSGGHCCRSSHFPWRGGSCRCGRGEGADHEGVQSQFSHRQSCWRPAAYHMERVSWGAYLHDYIFGATIVARERRRLSSDHATNGARTACKLPGEGRPHSTPHRRPSSPLPRRAGSTLTLRTRRGYPCW
jgi:hypothetical protein